MYEKEAGTNVKGLKEVKQEQLDIDKEREKNDRDEKKKRKEYFNILLK